MKNPVTRCRVVWLDHVVYGGEVFADRGLSVVGRSSGENKVVVCNGGLSGIDGVAAAYLIERVNRKRCGTIG